MPFGRIFLSRHRVHLRCKRFGVGGEGWCVCVCARALANDTDGGVIDELDYPRDYTLDEGLMICYLKKGRVNRLGQSTQGACLAKTTVRAVAHGFMWTQWRMIRVGLHDIGNLRGHPVTVSNTPAGHTETLVNETIMNGGSNVGEQAQAGTAKKIIKNVWISNLNLFLTTLRGGEGVQPLAT